MPVGMPTTGLEPVRPYGPRILSPLRLPFRQAGIGTHLIPAHLRIGSRLAPIVMARTSMPLRRRGPGHDGRMAGTSIFERGGLIPAAGRQTPAARSSHGSCQITSRTMAGKDPNGNKPSTLIRAAIPLRLFWSTVKDGSRFGARRMPPIPLSVRFRESQPLPDLASLRENPLGHRPLGLWTSGNSQMNSFRCSDSFRPSHGCHLSGA